MGGKEKKKKKKKKKLLHHRVANRKGPGVPGPHLKGRARPGPAPTRRVGFARDVAEDRESRCENCESACLTKRVSGLRWLYA